MTSDRGARRVLNALRKRVKQAPLRRARRPPAPEGRSPPLKAENAPVVQLRQLPDGAAFQSSRRLGDKFRASHSSDQRQAPERIDPRLRRYCTVYSIRYSQCTIVNTQYSIVNRIPLSDRIGPNKAHQPAPAHRRCCGHTRQRGSAVREGS